MNYISSPEILYIHSRLVTELKGKQGAKDITVIKKVVSYIKNNDVFPDKFKKAGALFFAIAKKRPFVDSNLQTAIFITKMFLHINKYDLNIDGNNVNKFIKINLDDAKVDDIAEWLQENSIPITKS